MEGDRFDTLTKTLTTTRSRRQALAGLALGALAVLGGETADAKRRRQRGHHGDGKHPADPNQSRCKYGCMDPHAFGRLARTFSQSASRRRALT